MTDLLIDRPTGDLDPGAPVSPPVVAAVPSLPAVDPSRLLDHRPAATRLPALGVPVGRAVIAWLLSGVEGGAVTLVEDGVSRTFRGRGSRPLRPGRAARHRARARPEVPHRHRGRRLVGLGEAYLEGWCDVDDLTGFLRLPARAFRRFDPAQRVCACTTRGPVTDRLRRLRPASQGRDRRNIAAHYDLGNDFFALVPRPDHDLQLGIFDHARHAAWPRPRPAKLDRLCRRLELEPDDRVVEIGTGWGAFAIHAAGALRRPGDHHHHQRRAVRLGTASGWPPAGLADRVEVRHDDYRDLTGTYDKLVSIEMIEAVDWRELDTFLAACSRLLEPDGLMGCRPSSSPGTAARAPSDSRDFIKTYIFPGGCLPSIEAISRSIGRASDLTLAELARLSACTTPRPFGRWRANLDAHRRRAALALGLDDRFLRLWEFYLGYCEAGFDEREISVVQLALERPGRAPSLDRGH